MKAAVVVAGLAVLFSLSQAQDLERISGPKKDPEAVPWGTNVPNYDSKEYSHRTTDGNFQIWYDIQGSDLELWFEGKGTSWCAHAWAIAGDGPKGMDAIIGPVPNTNGISTTAGDYFDHSFDSDPAGADYPPGPFLDTDSCPLGCDGSEGREYEAVKETLTGGETIITLHYTRPLLCEQPEDVPIIPSERVVMVAACNNGAAPTGVGRDTWPSGIHDVSLRYERFLLEDPNATWQEANDGLIDVFGLGWLIPAEIGYTFYIICGLIAVGIMVFGALYVYRYEQNRRKKLQQDTYKEAVEIKSMLGALGNVELGATSGFTGDDDAMTQASGRSRSKGSRSSKSGSRGKRSKSKSSRGSRGKHH